jgi:hypothetical protein
VRKNNQLNPMFRNPITPKDVPVLSSFDEVERYLNTRSASFFKTTSDATYLRQLLEGTKYAFPTERYICVEPQLHKTSFVSKAILVDAIKSDAALLNYLPDKNHVGFKMFAYNLVNTVTAGSF